MCDIKKAGRSDVKPYFMSLEVCQHGTCVSTTLHILDAQALRRINEVISVFRDHDAPAGHEIENYWAKVPSGLGVVPGSCLASFNGVSLSPERVAGPLACPLSCTMVLIIRRGAKPPNSST